MKFWEALKEVQENGNEVINTTGNIVKNLTDAVHKVSPNAAERDDWQIKPFRLVVGDQFIDYDGDLIEVLKIQGRNVIAFYEDNHGELQSTDMYLEEFQELEKVN